MTESAVASLPLLVGSLPDDKTRVLCVDGAWGALGLNLSHWPGNQTPTELRHDLSTGSALSFVELSLEEQQRHSHGCVCICNNHYDTDGTAAAFALLRPEQALARKQELLALARAGDFFEDAGDAAVKLDAAIAGLSDPTRSPLSSELEARSDTERWQLASEHWLEHLPDALDGDLEPYRALWKPSIEKLERDRAELGRFLRDDLVHLDWTVWQAPTALLDADPGRHALLGTQLADRVLVISPTHQHGAGHSYRLILSTLSWFDLVSREALPRPCLETLAAKLNELEGTSPPDEVCWRHQDASGASPELWFGTPELALFAETAGAALRPSQLAPEKVRAVIADELRAKLQAFLAFE